MRADLDRSWIHDSNCITLEVGSIEGQQTGDAVALHGGDQARIVRTVSSDIQLLDESMPARMEVGAVGEERESPLKERRPLAGLFGRHSQAILAARRCTGTACGDCPKLIQILRDNDDSLAVSNQAMNRISGNGALRIGRICDTHQQVRIKQNHSATWRS